MKKFIPLLIVFILFLVIDVDAQCAMCKENVASSQQNAAGDISNSFGSGLNTGILFLMAIPYFFLMSIAYIVFKKRIHGFFEKKFYTK